ncbi:MAG: hypothetical protein LBE21_02875 [Pseudomonadales bacterium]|nr:hypothetical protein [Pseudomonadales bacterium]
MQRSLPEGYRPHLQVDDGEYLGISFFDIAPEVEFGAPRRAKASLMYWPDVDYTPLQEGARFKVKEGSKTVGLGRVIRGWP